ncbi:MAG: hypothetical protein V1845_00045 [bacterium]
MEQLKSGPKEPLMMSGPKFGEQDGWWRRFSKNRSNIILFIIGILIIAGGIYLYSNYQNSKTLNPQEITQNQENQEGVVKPEEINLGDQGSSSQNQDQTSQGKAQIVDTQDGKITVKAEKGAGITHLARKALGQYLDQNADLKNSITPEHKIFIEDYLKDKTGTYGLRIGQELSFDEGLIRDAIDQAMKLNQNQLQNLHKYVLLVPSLSA